MSTPPLLLPRPVYETVRAEVQASQRGRLLVAMSEVVGVKGYAATTVADVLKIAHVSRRTFYEHFSDKEACFLAAYDYGVAAMREAIAAELAPAADWRERTRATIAMFLGLLGAEPGFARAFLIEIWAAGPAALQRHAEALEGFHAIMRALHDQARTADPTLVNPSDAQIAATIGGISRVASLEVLAGRAGALSSLTDELFKFSLAVLAPQAPA